MHIICQIFPYLSHKESSVAALCVVAESPTLQKHHPVSRGLVPTYEETSSCEIVAKRCAVRRRYPRHLVTASLRSLVHALLCVYDSQPQPEHAEDHRSQ